jgi:hypothetical protein
MMTHTACHDGSKSVGIRFLLNKPWCPYAAGSENTQPQLCRVPRRAGRSGTGASAKCTRFPVLSDEMLSQVNGGETEAVRGKIELEPQLLI